MKDSETIRALRGLLCLARELHKGVHVCDSGCEDAFEDAELVLEKRGRSPVDRNRHQIRSLLRKVSERG